MTKWLLDDAVNGNIYLAARNREVKWTYHIGNKEVGLRRTRISWHGDVRTWLRMLDADHRATDMYMSTNIIDWTAMPELPPQLKIAGIGYNKSGLERYKEIWDSLLTPADCKKQGLDFNKIWLGKNMVWDFDHPELDKAFEWALAVYNYLQDELGLSPQIVFSGNKGFHVWLNHKQSAALAGTTLEKLSANDDDPLRTLGKIYAKKVKEITFEATGELHRSLDLSPNYRQGIIRIPYSINSSSGQIVWPLSQEDINNLQELQVWSPNLISKTLHPKQWRESWCGKTTIRSPAAGLLGRNLSSFD